MAIEAFRAARRLASDGLGFGFSAAPRAQGLRFSGDALSMRRGSALRRPFLPWIGIDLVRRYRRSGDGAAFAAAAPATGGGEEFACGRPGRGRWESDSFSIRVRDLLGLARWERAMPERDEFVAAPAPRPFGIRPPAGGGGPERASPEGFKRSDEFLDSRKYHPGDDARRINWKQYGHSGELILRIGEREPPPKALYLLVVDPSSPGGLGPRQARAYAEDLVALAAGCAVELAERGARVAVAAPGIRPGAEGEEGGEAEAESLLAILSEIRPDDGSGEIELPGAEPRRGGRPRGTIVICPPGSRRAEAVLAATAGQRPTLAVPLARVLSRAEFLRFLVSRPAAVPAGMILSPRAARDFNARAADYARALGRTAHADAHAL